MSSQLEKLKSEYEKAKSYPKGKLVEVGKKILIVGTDEWEAYIESLRRQLKELLQLTIDRTEPYVRDIIDGLKYIGSLVQLARFEELARIDPAFCKQWQKLKECMQDPAFNEANKDKMITIRTVYRDGEPTRYYLVLEDKE